MYFNFETGVSLFSNRESPSKPSKVEFKFDALVLRNKYVDANIDLEAPSYPDAKSNINSFFTNVPFILFFVILLIYV